VKDIGSLYALSDFSNFEKKQIFIVFVPEHMTGLIQPIDLENPACATKPGTLKIPVI